VITVFIHPSVSDIQQQIKKGKVLNEHMFEQQSVPQRRRAILPRHEYAGLPSPLLVNVWGDHVQTERRLLPVSVKTRLGYDSIVITDWVQELLELEPAVISIHGRTLAQHYKGEANWDAIAAAAMIVRKTDTLILGNGDIHSLYEAAQRIRTTGVRDLLINHCT
jgi:hypothetical protein